MALKVNKRKSKFDVYELGDEIIISGKMVLEGKGALPTPKESFVEVGGVQIPVVVVTGRTPFDVAEELSREVGMALALFDKKGRTEVSTYENGKETSTEELNEPIEEVLKRLVMSGYTVFQCWTMDHSGEPLQLLGYAAALPPESIGGELAAIV